MNRAYTRPIDTLSSSLKAVRFVSKKVVTNSQQMTWMLFQGDQSSSFDGPLTDPSDASVDLANRQLTLAGQLYSLTLLSSTSNVDTYQIEMNAFNFIKFKRTVEALGSPDIAQVCEAKNLNDSRLVIDHNQNTVAFQFSLTTLVHYVGTSPIQSLVKIACSGTTASASPNCSAAAITAAIDANTAATD